MLELRQLFDRRGGQGAETECVEFPAGNGNDDVARVDQRGEDNRRPDGFQALPILVHVLHAQIIANQLGAVENLAVTLSFECVENVSRIPRLLRSETVAVEQFQRVEYGRRLSRAGWAGDGTEGILAGLLRTVPGNENREDGIFGGPVLEARAQADAGEGVHQVAKIDSFVGGNARELPDGLAASPLRDGFRAALEGDAEGVRDMCPQPLHQLAEELGGLGFVGGLGVAG